MKLVTVIALVLLVASGSASGSNVFKCRDSNGKIVYSDRPCEGERQVVKTYTGASGVYFGQQGSPSGGSPGARGRTIRCKSNFAGGSDCEFVN